MYNLESTENNALNKTEELVYYEWTGSR